MRQRVLCFGGRWFNGRNIVNVALSAIAAKPEFKDGFAIIHGGARGADSLCGEWGKAHALPVIVVDANWNAYPKSAGPIRNRWMMEFCTPTYAIGFPGQKGTADMYALLTAAGVPVWLPCEHMT